MAGSAVTDDSAASTAGMRDDERSLSGCDVSNHLSLFLCVANHDKLLPGWSYFTLFTIAVGNIDPKKLKYSDTLHRFWKKEHDWRWKKFMELSKIQDGFLVDDVLEITAQVQVIREKVDRPFRCLDLPYRRELLRVYMTNVEQNFRCFVEERRSKLIKLIEDRMKWSSFCAFWSAIDPGTKHRMSREKVDTILKVLVKHFFVGKEVTSTLVMDSLYMSLKALKCQRSKKARTKLAYLEELLTPMVHIDVDMFVLAGDVIALLERAAIEPLPCQTLAAKDDKSSQSRIKDGSSGEVYEVSMEREERRLTELGQKIIEAFVLSHIFSVERQCQTQDLLACRDPSSTASDKTTPVLPKSPPVDRATPVRAKSSAVDKSTPVCPKSPEVDKATSVHPKSPAVNKAAPVRTKSPAVEKAVPAHSKSPAVDKAAPVCSKSAAVDKAAPVRSNYPAVDKASSAQLKSPTGANDASIHSRSLQIDKSIPAPSRSIQVSKGALSSSELPQTSPATNSEAQKESTSVRVTTTSISDAVLTASRPSSAPAFPTPKTTAPSTSHVQKSTLLSCSMNEAAGRSTNVSSSAPSNVPHTYRNAIVGKPGLGNNSASLVYRSASFGQDTTPSQSLSAYASSTAVMMPPAGRSDQLLTRHGFKSGLGTTKAHGGYQLWKVDSNVDKKFPRDSAPYHQITNNVVYGQHGRGDTYQQASSIGTEKLSRYDLQSRQFQPETTASMIWPLSQGPAAEEFPHL